ncbi:sulfotransferase 2A1-like [Glandiceps talaboti]
MASLQKEETTQAVETTPLVTFQYRDVWFPSLMDEQKVKSDLVDDFSWRQSDVVVIGYPKSGSTWVSNILQNIQDFGLVSRGNSKQFLPFDWLIVNPTSMPGVRGEIAAQFQTGQLDLKSPRLIRSHLPLHLFPWKQARASNVKTICVIRNPKDVCVSMHHFINGIGHGKMALEWNKTVEEFAKGRIPLGPWLQHVIQWKTVGIEDNVLHVTYEDVKEDMSNAIRKFGNFLQVDLSDQDIQRIEIACSVEGMRESIHKYVIHDWGFVDGDVKQFVRKGIVGDWKNHFSVAQNEMFDEEIVSRLEEAGIPMKYELP